MTKRSALLLTAFLLLLILVAWLVGGPSNPVDVAVVRWLMKQRLAHEWLEDVGIGLTMAGSSPTTVGIALLGGAWLLWKDRHHRGLVFAAVILSGRGMIELIKALVGRARPALDPHPVIVHSTSFPSGHSGNSMLALLMAAMILVPERHRRPAVLLAVLGSVLVGMSRPLLGVHWPSDVIAGWSLGAAWALGGVAILRRQNLPR
ncbi:phosphatase PAP2 family protein [Sphingomonas ginkgonis]|uniref:Phosphatase PAP2 family protein n=1 Tax=Sphingomonas ginkgonis TaxID=2315330 RepID=A0A3R9Y5F4_9SPHN|nr:phosphatase PAP2 family protein [Sphingomonas ginkgonis]RST30515.1 phosphatase PAP2 family protein [Sphingomonas ginkgonis]